MNNTTAMTFASPYGFPFLVIFGSCVTVLSLVTILGNLMVLVSFYIDKNIRQPSNYFILSLAVSDLLIGLEGYPFYTLYVFLGEKWPLGLYPCLFWLSIDYTVCLASIYTVLLITIDRYCSVRIPAAYRNWRSKKRVKAIILITWLVPALLFFPLTFGWDTFTGNITLEAGQCWVPFMANQYVNLSLYISYYWSTLVVMVVLYTRIYKAARELQKKAEAKARRFSAMQAMQAPIKFGSAMGSPERAPTTSRGVKTFSTTTKSNTYEPDNALTVNNRQPSLLSLAATGGTKVKGLLSNIRRFKHDPQSSKYSDDDEDDPDDENSSEYPESDEISKMPSDEVAAHRTMRSRSKSRRRRNTTRRRQAPLIPQTEPVHLRAYATKTVNPVHVNKLRAVVNAIKFMPSRNRTAHHSDSPKSVVSFSKRGCLTPASVRSKRSASPSPKHNCQSPSTSCAKKVSIELSMNQCETISEVPESLQGTRNSSGSASVEAHSLLLNRTSNQSLNANQKTMDTSAFSTQSLISPKNNFKTLSDQYDFKANVNTPMSADCLLDFKRPSAPHVKSFQSLPGSFDPFNQKLFCSNLNHQFSFIDQESISGSFIRHTSIRSAASPSSADSISLFPNSRFTSYIPTYHLERESLRELSDCSYMTTSSCSRTNSDTSGNELKSFGIDNKLAVDSVFRVLQFDDHEQLLVHIDSSGALRSNNVPTVLPESVENATDFMDFSESEISPLTIRNASSVNSTPKGKHKAAPEIISTSTFMGDSPEPESTLVETEVHRNQNGTLVEGLASTSLSNLKIVEDVSSASPPTSSAKQVSFGHSDLQTKKMVESVGGSSGDDTEAPSSFANREFSSCIDKNAETSDPLIKPEPINGIERHGSTKAAKDPNVVSLQRSGRGPVSSIKRWINRRKIDVDDPDRHKRSFTEFARAIFGSSTVSKRRKARKKSRTENRARKAFRTITIILGAFILFWTPYYILATMYSFCQANCVSPPLYVASYYMCYLNSPLNPFCYAMANQQFKKTFQRILRGDFHRM